MIRNGGITFDDSESVSWDLLGYSMLLKGKFKIAFQQATELAQENGMDPKSTSVKLSYSGGNVRDLKSYTWAASIEINEGDYTLIQIDPMSGDVSKIRFVEEEGN